MVPLEAVLFQGALALDVLASARGATVAIASMSTSFGVGFAVKTSSRCHVP